MNDVIRRREFSHGSPICPVWAIEYDHRMTSMCIPGHIYWSVRSTMGISRHISAVLWGGLDQRTSVEAGVWGAACRCFGLLSGAPWTGLVVWGGGGSWRAECRILRAFVTSELGMWIAEMIYWQAIKPKRWPTYINWINGKWSNRDTLWDIHEFSYTWEFPKYHCNYILSNRFWRILFWRIFRH